MIEDAIQTPISDTLDIDSYDRLVDLGKAARNQMDHWRWVLGDYTLLLVTHFSRYGERTVEEYAEAIHIDAGRLYEFKEFAEFYPPEKRDELSELDLSYTHFREAKRLKNLDQAIELLKLAAIESMTVPELRRVIKNMELVEGIVVNKTYTAPMTATGPRYNPVKHPAWDGSMHLSFDDKGRLVLEDPDIPLPALEEGRRYRVIFEPIEE